MAEQNLSEHTGIRREGPAWGVYLRGRRVGECTIFSKAQATLAEAQQAETQPVQQTETKQGPIGPTPPAIQKVTIVAIGRRDWPGSRVVRDERLELVQVDSGETRPPRQPTTLAQALNWIEKAGLAPEATTSTGMAVWQDLSGGRGNVEARRKITFVRGAA